MTVISLAAITTNHIILPTIPGTSIWFVHKDTIRGAAKSFHSLITSHLPSYVADLYLSTKSLWSCLPACCLHPYPWSLFSILKSGFLKPNCDHVLLFIILSWLPISLGERTGMLTTIYNVLPDLTHHSSPTSSSILPANVHSALAYPPPTSLPALPLTVLNVVDLSPCKNALTPLCLEHSPQYLWVPL